METLLVQTLEGHDSSVLKVTYISNGRQLLSRYLQFIKRVAKIVHTLHTLLLQTNCTLVLLKTIKVFVLKQSLI